MRAQEECLLGQSGALQRRVPVRRHRGIRNDRGLEFRNAEAVAVLPTLRTGKSVLRPGKLHGNAVATCRLGGEASKVFGKLTRLRSIKCRKYFSEGRNAKILRIAAS